MIHTDILSFGNAKYLKWALMLIGLCLLIYLTQRNGVQPANGGTWQGYTTGTIGALLILWLSVLGIRKRQYHSTAGSVAGWTSAHVYLGAAVLIVATFHSSAQIGWNIHTLAYVLLCIVVFSGFFGIYLYMSLPRKSLAARDGRSRDQLFEELHTLNDKASSVAQGCSTAISVAVDSAIYGTKIGGNTLTQITGRDKSVMQLETDGKTKEVSNKDQQRILSLIAAQLPNAQRDTEVKPLQELLSVMSRRQVLVRRLTTDIRLQASMRFWLFIHVPFTVALIVSLVIHIIVTFLYW